VSASDRDHEQKTDPCTNGAGHESACARGTARDPQLDEFQCAGAYGEQDAAREQLHGARVTNGQQTANEQVCDEMLAKVISQYVRTHPTWHQRKNNNGKRGKPRAHAGEHH
jgi:hypothetical protein